MLHRLFYDYVNHPSFREELQKDPAPFLEKLGISAPEIELLRTRNMEGLRARLHQESDELLSQALQIAEKSVILYPLKAPDPITIAPTEGPANKQIDFTIFGSWLTNVSSVVFDNGQPYPANDLKLISESNFGSALSGNVTLPAAGAYQVAVKPKSSGLPRPVPGGFTVT